jgi:NAD(P)-dependent dehydrogenase (short-subunit alcohol dehydrogenase family)
MGERMTWLITGCSTGIGRGIARAALEAGENVVACARHPEALVGLDDDVPGALLAQRLDVTSEDEATAAVESARARFGPIDVLVNNAGYGYRAAVEESAPAQVERLFETNLYGPVRLMDLVLPEMRSRHAGTIVNVSSIGGVRAAVGNAFYSASKAALEMVSDGLRKELDGLGVRVLIVEPGAFRTSFYDSLEGSSRRIADYDATIAAMRVGEGIEQPHDQPGDPMAAGHVIVDVVRGERELPVRLPLGRGATQVLRYEYRARLDELASWKDVSASADFGDEGGMEDAAR